MGLRPRGRELFMESNKQMVIIRELGMNGEGIAGTDAENSIDKVGELAARGMSGTDRVILELMLS